MACPRINNQNMHILIFIFRAQINCEKNMFVWLRIEQNKIQKVMEKQLFFGKFMMHDHRAESGVFKKAQFVFCLSFLSSAVLWHFSTFSPTDNLIDGADISWPLLTEQDFWTWYQNVG